MHILCIYTDNLKSSAHSPHEESHSLHLVYMLPSPEKYPCIFFLLRSLKSVQADCRHIVNTHLIHLCFEILCDSQKLSWKKPWE